MLSDIFFYKQVGKLKIKIMRFIWDHIVSFQWTDQKKVNVRFWQIKEVRFINHN